MKPQTRNTFANSLILALIVVGLCCAVSTVLSWSSGWEIEETVEGE